jgi:hypothetical protein
VTEYTQAMFTLSLILLIEETQKSVYSSLISGGVAGAIAVVVIMKYRSRRK